MPNSLQLHELYSPWNSPGQNTGVGSLSLLKGIFPTQGLNPGLSHCRQILNQLSHKGSPRILEWVAYPFSSGSSWPRNRTGVSCIAGRFFTNWAMREALSSIYQPIFPRSHTWIFTEPGLETIFSYSSKSIIQVSFSSHSQMKDNIKSGMGFWLKLNLLIKRVSHPVYSVFFMFPRRTLLF